MYEVRYKPLDIMSGFDGDAYMLYSNWQKLIWCSYNVNNEAFVNKKISTTDCHLISFECVCVLLYPWVMQKIGQVCQSYCMWIRAISCHRCGEAVLCTGIWIMNRPGDWVDCTHFLCYFVQLLPSTVTLFFESKWVWITHKQHMPRFHMSSTRSPNVIYRVFFLHKFISWQMGSGSKTEMPKKVCIKQSESKKWISSLWHLISVVSKHILIND